MLFMEDVLTSKLAEASPKKFHQAFDAFAAPWVVTRRKYNCSSLRRFSTKASDVLRRRDVTHVLGGKRPGNEGTSACKALSMRWISEKRAVLTDVFASLRLPTSWMVYHTSPPLTEAVT